MALAFVVGFWKWRINKTKRTVISAFVVPKFAVTWIRYDLERPDYELLAVDNISLVGN